MLKIGQSKTVFPENNENLHNRLHRDGALEFHDVLDSHLQKTLTQIIDRATFEREEVKKLGYRGLETPPNAGNLLSLMMRRTEFLQWVGKVFSIDDINDVDGKIVETGKSANEELTWHDDLNLPHRRLGMTINLSSSVYEGGEFEMRQKNSAELLFEHKHECLGSMLIFKIASDLEHRLLPVTGGGPRRVYTGWFVNSSNA